MIHYLRKTKELSVLFLARLEADSSLLESLQQENTYLKAQIENQHQQLAVCQQEIEESRTMLTQLEQLAQQVQQNNNSRASSVSVLVVLCYKDSNIDTERSEQKTAVPGSTLFAIPSF